MRPQKSSRQVRRDGMRPAYYGRRQAKSSTISLPQLQIKAAWIKYAAIGAGILLVLIFVSQLTRLKTIKVVGLKGLDAGHVQRVAEEGVRKQWLGRNTILVNTGALVSYMRQAEPGIKDATVHRSGTHTIAISVSERQPSINWKSNNILYLLDASGTVIGTSRGAYVKLPEVVDSTNLSVKLGDRVAPSAFVSFCSTVWNQIGGTGLNPVVMVVPETTSEVNVKTDKSFVVKFDTTRSAAEELADLKAVQGELTKSRKVPGQYIDLRIPHKAYFK